MTKDEALRMALETLEIWKGYMPHLWDKTDEQAITAIKEALMSVPDGAQPEQEPVFWMYQNKSTHEVRFQKHMRSFVDHSKTSEVPLYSEPLANHELQCVCGAVWCGDEMVHLPNKAQPQRKPLMDEEIEDIWADCPADWDDKINVLTLARAIEAAVWEKQK